MMWYYKAHVTTPKGTEETREGVVPANYVSEAMDKLEELCVLWESKLNGADIFRYTYGHLQLVLSFSDKNQTKKEVDVDKPVTRVTKPAPQPFQFGSHWRPPTYATMTFKEN